MKCCNHVFNTKDIKPPLLNQAQAIDSNDSNLLGGKAKKFSHAECPECKKEHLLWLKPVHQSYEVIKVTSAEGTNDNYCQECDRSFKSEQGLKVHINQKHKS